MAKSKNNQKEIPFYKKLILNHYLLDLLGFNNFSDLAVILKNVPEGIDENKVSYFYNALISSNAFLNNAKIDKEVILAYDMNIIRLTRKMQGQREEPVFWKYFQWLCLIFIEIFLDKCFADKQAFCNALNSYKNEFFQNFEISDYAVGDLNKIAIWNATGSGKTLLMHLNILQYKYYLEKYKRTDSINRILLITPNEGLSKQHLKNFKLSNINAEIFNKNTFSTLFAGNIVEIIEISKLKEEGKETTVSVDSFEDNNLTLIDEVHKGTQGNEWKKNREKLFKNGFAFEYSATLGQAVESASKADKTALVDEYAKVTLFDYSYRYFYNDGYGKDYRILNLEDKSDETFYNKYLIGCLLSYYQQLVIYSQNTQNIKPFNIFKPLWVFVGATVSKGRNSEKATFPDVVNIILFLNSFIKNKKQSIEYLNSITQSKGLIDQTGKAIFSNTFSFILSGSLFGEALYNDILKRIFNTNVTGNLHIENLKGSNGEISLKIGENKPFGLINVGDSSDLLKLLRKQEDQGIVIDDKNFTGSLFDTITSNSSDINILIGSRKFTEGWDCYRVSTMGLMNIGKSEGSEIIQLFGRGVRLKGLNNCLKRSNSLDLPEFRKNKEKASLIKCLETLNIFGIKADYMQQFKKYLQEEGLPLSVEEYIIPVINNIPNKKLKIIKVKDGVDFKKQAEKPNLVYDTYMAKHKISLDWYPKIQALKSQNAQGGNSYAYKDECIINEKLLCFLDYNKLFLDLQDFKAEKCWYNLNISIDNIKDIISHNDWYYLYIPKDELLLRNFSIFERIYDIVLTLLKKYCERYYLYKKSDWEKDKLEYKELSEDDDNLIDEYTISIKEENKDSVKDLLTVITKINDQIKQGRLEDIQFNNFTSLCFDSHLYNPILSITNKDFIEVKPVTLNEGEMQFVADLKQYYNQNKEAFHNTEIYLLRNRSKGKGTSFFEEVNFYPDFILWYLKDGKQYITFIDPKGIRNLDGKNDPKVTLAQRIKDLQNQLNNPEIILNSAIISVTDYYQISWRDNWTKEDFIKHNVLFQKDADYIHKMFANIK